MNTFVVKLSAFCYGHHFCDNILEFFSIQVMLLEFCGSRQNDCLPPTIQNVSFIQDFVKKIYKFSIKANFWLKKSDLQLWLGYFT
jgi:hypothetical protein